MAADCEECKIKERLLAEAHQKIGRLTDDCRDLYEELKIVRRREERATRDLRWLAREYVDRGFEAPGYEDFFDRIGARR